MVLSIYTKNASNLTKKARRYGSGRVDGRTDRKMDRWMDDAKTISLRFHRGKLSTKQRINFHAQEHDTVFQVRLEPQPLDLGPSTLPLHDCAPQLGSILCRYNTYPTQYAPDLRVSIFVYGAFCGSSQPVLR